MLQPRIVWEEKERALLAPYATLSSDSAGRDHPEAVHIFRSEYQRDRDRIVHSASFRRLEYKTQVVLNGTGDHFRTRLTHTIEVAAIARTVARTLALNEDLAEAVALAHDLGHPPFGHPGEHTLNRLMADHGGFEHNRQSLRVVEDLEVKYPEFNGLNLSREVRDGIYLGHARLPAGATQPSLEAQVADAADEIAYCCHDLDDAVQNGMIETESLESVDLWKKASDAIRKSYSRLDEERRHTYLIRCLIDFLVDDLCRQSSRNIEEVRPVSARAAQRCGQRLIGFTLETRAGLQNLRDHLQRHFYFHPRVAQTNQRACLVLQGLFAFYHKHPHLLGGKAALRIKKDGISRAVCDYVAGMTDRYALQQYARHVGTDNLLKELLPSTVRG
jgi:dGTPase